MNSGMGPNGSVLGDWGQKKQHKPRHGRIKPLSVCKCLLSVCKQFGTEQALGTHGKRLGR